MRTISADAGIFAKNIYRLGTIASTQDALKELFQHGAAEGTIVIARGQTQGRGRRDRSWDSGEDMGLWMSALLEPEGAEDLWSWVPLWAGIAARRALIGVLKGWSDFQPEALRLKWPNDIMLDNRKLGGILSERVQNRQNRQAVILGLGINLLQTESDFPPEIREKAVSLFQVSNRILAPDTVLNSMIANLDNLLPLLKPIRADLIKEIWLQYAWGWEQKLHLQSGTERIEGVFSDLGEHGEICLTVPDRGTIPYASAEFIELAQ
jgi:BirA family biotin operon repressor/biotin-[acetyl-CoA-carboxylase] ligase